MTRRIATIELKIPDNAAFTALTALRRLGIEAAVVRRSDVWDCEDAGDGATFADRMRANADIFNQNLHRLIVLPSAQPRVGEVWIGRRDEDDGRHSPFGGKGVAGVSTARHYAGWRLEGRDGTPVRRDVLRAAVVALLCNPAIETATY